MMHEQGSTIETQHPYALTAFIPSSTSSLHPVLSRLSPFVLFDFVTWLNGRGENDKGKRKKSKRDEERP